MILCNNIFVAVMVMINAKWLLVVFFCLLTVLIICILNCVSKNVTLFTFTITLSDVGRFYLILDTIIGQSIYNVPALSYLLETENFSIVEYQLKCCSVADNVAPDCHMVWSGAACCRQGHHWVAWTAARLCKSWCATLRTFALSRKLLLWTDFTV